MSTHITRNIVFAKRACVRLVRASRHDSSDSAESLPIELRFAKLHRRICCPCCRSLFAFALSLFLCVRAVCCGLVCGDGGVVGDVPDERGGHPRRLCACACVCLGRVVDFARVRVSYADIAASLTDTVLYFK